MGVPALRLFKLFKELARIISFYKKWNPTFNQPQSTTPPEPPPTTLPSVSISPNDTTNCCIDGLNNTMATWKIQPGLMPLIVSNNPGKTTIPSWLSFLIGHFVGIPVGFLAGGIVVWYLKYRNSAIPTETAIIKGENPGQVENNTDTDTSAITEAGPIKEIEIDIVENPGPVDTIDKTYY